MENLNAEQIKYCLELILKSGIGMSRDDVDVTDIKRALALITSQEQRIKELTEENESLEAEKEHLELVVEGKLKRTSALEKKVLEFTEKNADWEAIAEGYQKQFEDCAEDRARLTEENERLRAENELLLNIKNLNLDKVIADTVRKMQERLISEFRKDDRMNYYIRMTLDQIAKEMLEGGDQG